jgi:DNA-binding NarL/FixJ family response regulator
VNYELSPRERETLRLIADGHNSKSAAQELSLSFETVKDHLQAARWKLGARTTAQAAVKAAQQGVI